METTVIPVGEAMTTEIKKYGAMARRAFLAGGLAAPGMLLMPGAASAQGFRLRRLNLINAHTGDRFDDAYWEKGRYIPDALEEIDWLLRDVRADAVARMDRSLLDILSSLTFLLQPRHPFVILSGYRTPRTNRMLRRENHGVAEHSMHIVARAVDICCEGVRLSDLRRAAERLKAGGVGYYPESGFVHVDTGPIRYW